MHPTFRVQPKQLVDQHKKFNRLAIQSLYSALGNVEKDYQTVSIIGVQNSGKSTLLNNLFGTNFQVLQKSIGERTTLGIWTSLDKQANIIVMDVQGNDAMVRSNQQEYQKMVSTFALVQADTLIINVWSKTLGQYTGSQYETLNAVMQICISQFKQQSPKTLLFCVRDFNDEEQEEGELRRKINKDVNHIWSKIQKPSQIAKYNQTPERFFTIEVACLRKYKKQNPKNFVEDVKKLRERFVNLRAEGYVFKSKKNSLNLPLKDLPQLAQNLWNSIITNKKLNLPNEKQQLSNYRCLQILNDLLNAFKFQLDTIEHTKSAVDLGKIITHYTQDFEAKTYNYAKQIVEQKQKTLKQQMDDTIKRVINQILDSEEKKLKEQFRKNSSFVNQQNSQTLEGKLIEIKNQTLEKYSHIFRTFNFQVEDRKTKIEKLSKFLNKENSESLVKAKDIIKTQFEKECSRQMRLLSSELLKKYFGVSFWSNVENQYVTKRNLLIKSYEKKVLWAENRIFEATEIDLIDEEMSTQLKNVIREELKKNLMNKAYDMFIRDFTKNKEGVPHNFNILEQKKISQLYDKARDHARDFVSAINLYNIKRSRKSTIIEFEEEEKDEFFQSTWLSNSLNEFDKKMITEHQTIVRRKKEEEMRKVPAWLIAIIVFFVYDDLWFPSDTHPVTNNVLTVFLIFIGFFFSIGQHRAFMEIWKLLLDLFKRASEAIQKKIGK